MTQSEELVSAEDHSLRFRRMKHLQMPGNICYMFCQKEDGFLTTESGWTLSLAANPSPPSLFDAPKDIRTCGSRGQKTPNVLREWEYEVPLEG